MLTPPATAHDWGVYPDSATHTWCMGATTDSYPDLKDAIRYAMTNLDSQTDMSVPISGGCASSTDVQWVEANIAPARGQWDCIDGSGSTCFKARLTVDYDQINFESGPLGVNLRKTACHELGHSVGQDHHAKPYGDCLVSGAVDSLHQDYNGDHVGFINARW